MSNFKYDFFISHTTEGGGRYIALELQSCLSYFGLAAYVASLEGLMVRDEDFLDNRMHECRSFLAVATENYVRRLYENTNDPKNWIAYEFRHGMSNFLPHKDRGMFVFGFGDWSRYTLNKGILGSAVVKEFSNNKLESGERRAFWIVPGNKSLSAGITQILHLARTREETRKFFYQQANVAESVGTDYGSQAILYFSSLINPQQAFADYFREFFAAHDKIKINDNFSKFDNMKDHVEKNIGSLVHSENISNGDKPIRLLPQKYLYANTTGAAAYAGLFQKSLSHGVDSSKNSSQGVDSLNNFLRSVYVCSSGYFADGELELYVRKEVENLNPWSRSRRLSADCAVKDIPAHTPIHHTLSPATFPKGEENAHPSPLGGEDGGGGSSNTGRANTDSGEKNTDKIPRDSYLGHRVFLKLCADCLSQAMKTSLSIVALGAGVGIREARLVRDMLAMAWRTAIEQGQQESFKQLQGHIRYIFTDISIHLVTESFRNTQKSWSLAEVDDYLVDFLRINKQQPEKPAEFDEREKCNALNELRETLAQIDITSCFASFRDIHNLQYFLRRSNNARNLFLLLGNTYNVMSQEERRDFIRNLSVVSECGDYLLVELDLKSGIEAKKRLEAALKGGQLKEQPGGQTEGQLMVENQREWHEFLLSFAAGRPSWKKNNEDYYVEAELNEEGMGVYRYPVVDSDGRVYELWYAKIKRVKMPPAKIQNAESSVIYFPITLHPTGWRKYGPFEKLEKLAENDKEIFKIHAHDLIANKDWLLDDVICTTPSEAETKETKTIAIGLFRRLP